MGEHIDDLLDESITHENCDYIAFVDASGDDGFKFTVGSDGSSICYAVCMFLCKKEDVTFNIEVLDEIKKVIGCKLEHEIKYTTMRRHRNSNKAHELVSKFKGKIVSWVAFKPAITDEYFLDLKQKNLSKFCHSFPIMTLNKILKSDPDKNVFIAVDVMKKTEMDGVSLMISDSQNDFGFLNGERIINKFNLKFKDSKDKNFKLIQVADIFSGIIRSSCEKYYLNIVQFPKCKFCVSKKMRNSFFPRCMKKNKHVIRKDLDHLFKLENLFFKENDKIFLKGITFYPIATNDSMLFIDCFSVK